MDLFYDYARFSRESVVDIDAAVVGVSRAGWTSLEESEATTDRARDLMQYNRFDILPITNGRTVKKYYSTIDWNDYRSVVEYPITRQDIIPHQTPMRDVIRGLATENRRFYFLSAEHHIVGFLSVANLNCRQVRVYMFSLLSELEIRLGELIVARIPLEDIRALTLESGKDKYKATKERVDSDKQSGLDVPLIEYLYLSDLLSVVAKHGLFTDLGFSSRKTFEKHVNPLNDLRNAIAHPTRSLISNADTVVKLWRDIDQIEELLFKLR